MHQFRTDALSIAMIVGGATLAGGATLLLANAGGEADTASRCSHVATAQQVLEKQQRVVVALNGGDKSVVVAPTVEVSACAPAVRVTDVTVQKLDPVDLRRVRERADLDGIREAERKVREVERRIREQERIVRSEERERRAQEREVRARERQEIVVEREIRARERQERALERSERARERAQRRQERDEHHSNVVVWSGDEDFDFDFDHDFDFDFEDLGFAFEIDGESIVIDLDGLENLSLALEGLEGEIDLSALEDLNVELEGLDAELGDEIGARIEEAMRELEQRLGEMNERPGGGA